jgi:predicted nicotinamide N-methyase
MLDEGKIDVRDKVVLELGSGTGLAGLVCGKVGSQLTIMTDYHPVVIKNCVENIERNHLDNVICLELDWRWIYEGFSQQDKRLDQKFELVLAADCIFDLSHSELVPKIAKHYLSPTGVFHLILPHRIKFKKEIEAFEKNMILEGFVLEYSHWIEKHALDFRYYIYKIQSS